MPEKRESLEFYASDIDMDFDNDISDEELEAAIIERINELDDEEWDAMDEQTKLFINEVNKRLAEQVAEPEPKQKEKEPEPEPPAQIPEPPARTDKPDLKVVPKKDDEKGSKKGKEKETMSTKKATNKKASNKKAPTKKELEAAKKAAAKKAESAPKKQTISESPFRVGTSAFFVVLPVALAGKNGASQEDVAKQFKASIKKHNITCSNVTNRLYVIMKQAINNKNLVEERELKSGAKKYYPTKHMNEVYKDAIKEYKKGKK